MQLSLWFVNSAKPELAEIFVQHPVLGERVTRRGKGLVYTDDNGSFQWTAAVKAFSQLAVGTRLQSSSDEAAPYVLSGIKGSAAASLDYAISKPTAWISDLFAVKGKRGELLRQIFRIKNSNLKLPGPVEIHLSSMLRTEGSLSIYLADRQLTSPQELERLLIALGGLPLASERATRQPLELPRKWYEKSTFRSSVEHEIEFGLSETYLMESLGVRKAKQRLAQYQEFGKSKSIATVLEDLEKNLSPDYRRYRLSKKASPKVLRVRAACTPMAVAAMVVMREVDPGSGFKFEVSCDFPGTTSIIKAADLEDFDCMVLSWGAIQRLRKGYADRALMLLPRTSFDLLHATGSRAEESGEVSLSIDPLGYPHQYLRELVKQRNSPLRRLRAVDATMAEIAARLRYDSSAAILGFPFSQILAQELGMEIYESGNPLSRVGDNVLLCVARPIFDKAALSEALRQSWFRLLEDRKHFKESIARLLSDSEYIRVLRRLGGLFTIEHS